MNKKQFLNIAASKAEDLVERILKDKNEPFLKLTMTTLLLDYANDIADAMHLEELEHDKL